MTNIVLCTGGFDPLHSGHIAYFKEAKKLGNKLVIGLNSDAWLTRKKGRPFMPWEERASIIRELKIVDDVIEFDDSDGSANFAIYKCLQNYPNDRIIFANGGDRVPDNCPEFVYKQTPFVEFAWGVGGDDKKNSSSWILKEWKNPKTDRQWGWYSVLDERPGMKVKELVISPGKSLSDQRHFKRSEHWFVLKGSCSINTEYNGLKNTVTLAETNTFVIPVGTWHHTTNILDVPCHILEVQYGELCIEEDIERRP